MILSNALSRTQKGPPDVDPRGHSHYRTSSAPRVAALNVPQCKRPPGRGLGTIYKALSAPWLCVQGAGVGWGSLVLLLSDGLK